MIVRLGWGAVALMAIVLTVVWPLVAWAMQPMSEAASNANVVSSASAQTLWLRTVAWSLGLSLIHI